MNRGFERLEFPQGVRFPSENEFPAGYEHERERIANAQITIGYTQQPAQGMCTDYFEANIHASEIWKSFKALVRTMMDEVAAPIVAFCDEEPILGPYTDRDAALLAFEPHAHELAHDGMIAFGMIFQHDGRTEEVFVTKFKFFKIWTCRPDRVFQAFAELDVPKAERLQFVDEFPRVTNTLMTQTGEASYPLVQESLAAAFALLPHR